MGCPLFVICFFAVTNIHFWIAHMYVYIHIGYCMHMMHTLIYGTYNLFTVFCFNSSSWYIWKHLIAYGFASWAGAFTLVQTQGTGNGFARSHPWNLLLHTYSMCCLYRRAHTRRVKKFLPHTYVNTSLYCFLSYWCCDFNVFACICMCVRIYYITFAFIWTYMTWHRMNITISWNPPMTKNSSP